jgi:hypothetical protein
MGGIGLKKLLAIGILVISHAAVAHGATNTGQQSQSVSSGKDSASSVFNNMTGQSRFRNAVGAKAFIDYKTVSVPSKVFLLNTTLLEEWGLKGVNAERLSAVLVNSVKSAFARKIINEFDQEPSPEEIQPGLFMATRYMNTGDGRAIWNGQFDLYDTSGKLIAVIDVSSKGTGSTAMRLEQDLSGGYGDGKASLDEFVGGYIQGEIMHRNGFQTERTLVILDLGDGQSVGVRVGAPLLRPSHIFYWEKRGNGPMTKNVIDYHIQLERLNGRGEGLGTGPGLYNRWLKKEAEALGKLIAMVESRYIFLWLAVDGDNMILPGGIIDYGSIRQFGLPYFDFRHENRSINVWETQGLAKLILSKLIRSVELARAGKKVKGPHNFSHPLFEVFEKSYQETRLRDLLLQFGFTRDQIESIVKSSPEIGNQLVRMIDRLIKMQRGREFKFNYIDEESGYEKMAPPLYDVRKLLRLYADVLARQTNAAQPHSRIEVTQMLKMLESKWSTKESMKPSVEMKRITETIQSAISTFLTQVSPNNRIEQLALMAERAKVANREFRLSGNGGSAVSTEIINLYNNGATPEMLNVLTENVIRQNIEDPDSLQPRFQPKKLPAKSCSDLLRWEKKLEKIIIENQFETRVKLRPLLFTV